MTDFLRNLAILLVIGLVLFILLPSTFTQIFEIYNGLGILLPFIVVLLVSALPRKRSSRRRRR